MTNTIRVTVVRALSYSKRCSDYVQVMQNMAISKTMVNGIHAPRPLTWEVRQRTNHCLEWPVFLSNPLSSRPKSQMVPGLFCKTNAQATLKISLPDTDACFTDSERGKLLVHYI